MPTVSIWNQITTEFFGNVAAPRAAWPSTHIACLAVYNCGSSAFITVASSCSRSHMAQCQNTESVCKSAVAYESE
jgi:hypothetical protein